MPPLEGTTSVDKAKWRADTIAKLQEVALKAIDRGAAYNTVILALGYASTFTMWSFIRTQIPERTNIWIALLLMSSLILFIGFEVFKMLNAARYTQKLISVVDPSLTMDEFEKALTKLQEYEFRYNRRVANAWGVIIGPCIATGFGAGFLLGYNVLATLFRWTRWPA